MEAGCQVLRPTHRNAHLTSHTTKLLGVIAFLLVIDHIREEDISVPYVIVTYPIWKFFMIVTFVSWNLQKSLNENVERDRIAENYLFWNNHFSNNWRNGSWSPNKQKYFPKAVWIKTDSVKVSFCEGLFWEIWGE